MGAIEDARRAEGIRGAPRRIMPPVRRAPRASLAAAQRRGLQRGISQREEHAPGKNIFHQVGDILHGVPGGLIGMGKEIVNDAFIAPVRVGIDIAQGDVGDVDDYYKFLPKTGSSFKRTGGRVTNAVASLAPGGLKPSETEYAKASRESGIVGAAIEDIGNASIIGAAISGGASVAAGRAGASAVAAREAAAAATAEASTGARVVAGAVRRGAGHVEAGASSGGATRFFEGATAGPAEARYFNPEVGRLVDEAAGKTVRHQRLAKVSDQIHGAARKLDVAGAAPVRAFTEPAKLAFRAARPLIERAGGTELGQAAAKSIETWRANRVSDANFRRDILDPKQETRLAGVHGIGINQRKADRVWREASKVSGYSVAALNEARLLYEAGADVLFSKLRDVERISGPELARTINRETMGIETAVTPEALEIIGKRVDGTLEPTAVDAIERAWAFTKTALEQVEEKRLEGTGRLGSALSEEQLLDEPMPSAVERQLDTDQRRVMDLEDDVEGVVDPKTGKRGPGFRSRHAAAAAADQARREAGLQRMMPAGAVERVEGVARRQGGVEALTGASDRLFAEADRPLAPPRPAGTERVMGPVERAARAEGRIEGRVAAGEDLQRRGERMAEPSEAQIARATKGASERVVAAEGREAAAEAAGAAARGRLEQQLPSAAPEQRWWGTRSNGEPVVVAADAPITKAERDAVKGEVNDLAVRAHETMLTGGIDIDISGQTGLPALPKAGTVGGEWDWVDGLSAEERAAYAAQSRQRARATGISQEEGASYSGPDEWQDLLGAESIDAAAQEIIRRIRVVTSLDQLSRGFRPWFEEDLPMDLTPAETALMQSMPVESTRGFGGEFTGARTGAFVPGRKSWKGREVQLDRAVHGTRAARNELAEADLAGPDPGVGPWNHMDEQTWVEEGERLYAAVEAEAGGLVPDAEFGAMSADLDRLEAELDAHYGPLEFAEDGVDSSVLFNRLRDQTARHHPDEVDYQISTADMDAVGTAETRAYEAWAEDHALGEAGDRSTPNFATLAEEERAIYAEFAETARVSSAREALDKGRERAVASLRKRSPGRVVAREGGRLVDEAPGPELGPATRLTQQRQAAASTLEEGGARRGRLEGEQAATEGIARDLGDRAVRADRELNPVMGLPRRDRAVAALEKRLEGTAFRQGEQTGRLQRDTQIAKKALTRGEEKLDRARTKLADHIAELEQGPASVVPGKHRTVLLINDRFKQGLLEAANEKTLAAAQDAGVAVDRWSEEIAEFATDEVQALIALADAIPVTLRERQAEFAALGREEPGYLPGAHDEPLSGGFVGGGKAQLPKEGVTSAERMKRSGRIPKRTSTVSRELVREIVTLADNQAAERMQTMGYARPAREFIADLRGTIDDDIIDDVLAGRTAERANDIGHALKRAGYTGWDPKAPQSAVLPASINLETLFIPTRLFDQFRRTFDKDTTNALVKYGIDKPTTMWKHAVLAANPYWHIGNMAGNAMLASIAGGVAPHVLMREGWRALKMLTEEGSVGPLTERIVRYMAKDLEQSILPARLFDAGMAADALRLLESGDQELSRGMRAIRGSYTFNNFVDNWGRSTVFLAKEAKGLSTEQAVHASLRAMGDFSNMKPFEQNIVRRIIPFYAWQRHVVQLAWRLPVYHPYRVAATFHMANMFAPKLPDGTPEWLQASIPWGDSRFLNMSSFNPFASGLTPLTAGGEGNPVAEISRSLNPVAQLGIGIGTGFNTRQFRMMTRPPGSGHHDAEGRPVAGPLTGSEALWQFAQQTPQTRALAAIFGGNKVRYDQGDVMKAGGRDLEQEGPLSESIMRNLGLPWPVTINTAEHKRRADLKIAANRRSRERYARQ